MSNRKTHVVDLAPAAFVATAKRRPAVVMLALRGLREGDDLRLVEVDPATGATGRYIETRAATVVRGPGVAKRYAAVGLYSAHIRDPKKEVEAERARQEAERRRHEPSSWSITRNEGRPSAAVIFLGCRGTVELTKDGRPGCVTFGSLEPHVRDVEKNRHALQALVQRHFGPQYAVGEPAWHREECSCDGDGDELAFDITTKGWIAHRIDDDPWPEIDEGAVDFPGLSLREYADVVGLDAVEIGSYRLAALGRPAIRGPLGIYPTGAPVLIRPGADHFYVIRPPVVH